MEIKQVPRFTEELKNPIEVPTIFPTTHTAIFAPSLSGKSLMLVNLLTRKRAKLCYYYSRIYIVNPTIKVNDENYDIIKVLQENHKVVKDRQKQKAEYIIIDEITDKNDFESIIEFITQECSEDPHLDKLIVIDDCAKFLNLNDTSLENLYTNGRHFGITVFCSVQSITKLPPVCRDNSMNFILFKSTKQQTKKIVDIIGEDEQEFLSKLKQATKKKYSFLCYRTREDDEHKYSENFERFI